MGESINWYMRWAGRQIEPWLATTWPQLTSDEAIRIYALAALFILTASAAFFGYFAKKKLTDLEKAALNLSFRGPDPKHEDRIEKREESLQTRAAGELKPFRSALWKLLTTGLIIPTIIFVIVSMNYNWFDPVGLPFIDTADKIPLQTADDTTLTLFALNQFFHGALFDVLEVFNINAVAITNNPNNYWFSGAVLLYRSLISAFIVALFLGWAQILCVRRIFRKKIKEEIARLQHGAQTTIKNAS